MSRNISHLPIEHMPDFDNLPPGDNPWNNPIYRDIMPPGFFDDTDGPPGPSIPPPGGGRPDPTENTPAIIGGTDTGRITEDQNNIATGTLTIIDPDRGDAWFMNGAFQGDHGTLFLDMRGTWVYLVDSSVQSLQEGEKALEIFEVSSVDGTPHSVQIALTGVNDAPVVTGNFNGLITEDVDLTASGHLTVADADHDESGFQEGYLSGSYGDLIMGADGTWLYGVSDEDALQALRQNESAFDVFTVHTTDGTAQNVTVNLVGVNDEAVIGGIDTGSVTEDGEQSTTGRLTIEDVDRDEEFFQSAGLTGKFGWLAIDDQGNWQYTLDNSNSAVQALRAGQTLTDPISVQALDGTSHDIEITINGADEGGFFKIDPSASQMVFSLSDMGFAEGATVTVTLVGDFRASYFPWATPPYNQDIFQNSTIIYDGEVITSGSPFALSAGTSITVVNHDDPLW
ncbi:MAG: hypothetical protein E5W15_02555, partial [Mesorhizobium sp.]